MANSDSILEKLNSEQRSAVTYGDGPLLIVAGAGTGKTTVITRRVAWLIAERRARLEEILALTFTDKAAEEMEERVDILLPYGYTPVWISTFHAFGDRVLRENSFELGLAPDLRVLTRPEQVIFFRDHLFEFPLKFYRPLGNPTRYIDAIITLISRAKDEDVSPEEYLNYAQELLSQAEESGDPARLEEANRELEVVRTYKRYQELMAEHHYIDFGDQVCLALKLFREHPSILKRYQQRFRYILVDEFQDTNYAQFELVKLLAEIHRNITVVGDDDQSIYKFRGAAISNILGFKKAYPDACQIVLVENYRSPQALLDTAYRLIRYNNPDRLEVQNQIDKHLIAVTDSASPGPVHLHYDSVFSEADGVAKLIGEKVNRGEYRYQDFCVLVRANDDADPFLRALNYLSIPWRFTGNQGLYSREEIRLLINFLRAISDFDDSPSLYYLASAEPYQLGPEDLVRCASFHKRHHRSLYQVFSRLDEYPELSALISAEGRTKIEKLLADLKLYADFAVKHPTGEVLYKFITATGYLKRLVDSEKEEEVRNIARFFDQVRNTSQILAHDRVAQFIEHLDLLIEAGDNPAVVEADPLTDAVSVLTLHKAKGLEFKVVIMVGLVADRFPTRYRREQIPLPDELVKDILPSGDFHLQEERRLFYVGMTRAAKELYLTSAEDYGGKRIKRVSPFVIEALDLPVRKLKPYEPSALERIERHAPRVSSPPSVYGPIPEDQLLSLSYFQIDDYLSCPLKYKFVHILHSPVMRHHAVIYGKALHDAVQEYFRRKLQGQPVTEEDLLAVFKGSWVSEGFLSREHEEQRFAEGCRTLRRFFVEQEALNRLPTYIEREFSFRLGRNRVIGRWDRVDLTAHEVVIIDFKSSDVREQRKADEEAKKSLQLSIYALAYQQIFNRIPDRVELHFLESGLIGSASKTPEDLEQTISRIEAAAAGVRARRFDAQPDHWKCQRCVCNAICPETLTVI